CYIGWCVLALPMGSLGVLPPSNQHLWVLVGKCARGEEIVVSIATSDPRHATYPVVRKFLYPLLEILGHSSPQDVLANQFMDTFIPKQTYSRVLEPKIVEGRTGDFERSCLVPLISRGAGDCGKDEVCHPRHACGRRQEKECLDAMGYAVWRNLWMSFTPCGNPYDLTLALDGWGWPNRSLSVHGVCWFFVLCKTGRVKSSHRHQGGEEAERTRLLLLSCCYQK
ncbi:hypothetical protein J6590_103607, partial [Homalodisca vitripennis]